MKNIWKFIQVHKFPEFLLRSKWIIIENFIPLYVTDILIDRALASCAIWKYNFITIKMRDKKKTEIERFVNREIGKVNVG